MSFILLDVHNSTYVHCYFAVSPPTNHRKRMLMYQQHSTEVTKDPPRLKSNTSDRLQCYHAVCPLTNQMAVLVDIQQHYMFFFIRLSFAIATHLQFYC